MFFIIILSLWLLKNNKTKCNLDKYCKTNYMAETEIQFDLIAIHNFYHCEVEKLTLLLFFMWYFMMMRIRESNRAVRYNFSHHSLQINIVMCRNCNLQPLCSRALLNITNTHSSRSGTEAECWSYRRLIILTNTGLHLLQIVLLITRRDMSTSKHVISISYGRKRNLTVHRKEKAIQSFITVTSQVNSALRSSGREMWMGRFADSAQIRVQERDLARQPNRHKTKK